MIKKNIFPIFVVVVVALILCATSYFRLRSRVKSLWVADISIVVTEQNTTTNVPAFVGPIPSPDRDGLPVVLSLEGASKPEMKWHFLITNDKPLTFEVSAKDFKTESVTINESGSREIKVELAKKGVTQSAIE